ncbi:lytic polysaccharide monooxygenase [Arhodomonas sp. AD133]|uniref:lytic polysaccharide monooxygenase n=1 Tax=Arhodomonas sp. AD133 TaxID=3415009 RepID=UPI003EB85611
MLETRTRTITTLLGLTLLGASTSAGAHGSLSAPMSRQYACFQDGPESPSSPSCQALGTAIYDWNGVRMDGVFDLYRENIPDGELCSLGIPKFEPLDEMPGDFPSTVMAPGTHKFTYYPTAVHATKRIALFITRDGYDRTQPLGWESLESEPFCTVADSALSLDDDGRWRFSCTVPAEKSGNHVIYTIWQTDNGTGEIFGGCSDVFVSSDGTGDPGDGDGGTDIPAWNPDQVYDEAGQVVRYEGAKYRNRWWTQGDNPATAPVWERLDTGDGGLPAWSTETTYTAGDRVEHDGNQWEARWWNQGQVPSSDPDGPWKQL